MINTKEDILILLREFQDSNVEIGKYKEKSQYGVDVSLYEGLNSKSLALKLKILDYVEALTKDSQHLGFKPGAIRDRKLISQKVLDFAFQWEIEVRVISHNDFIYLNRLLDRDNNKKLISFQGRLYGIDRTTKSIYFDETFTSEKSSIDSLALHEMCHILLLMEPQIINEAASPLYSLWYHFMKYCEVDHKMFNADERFTRNMQALSPKQFSTIKEYVESFIPELVELNLLKEDGSPTFVRGNFYPKQSWLLANLSTF